MIITKIKKIFRVLKNPLLYLNLLHNLRKTRELDDKPIIVCGCPRSGTSLLVSILDSHQEIHAIPFETTVLQYRPLDKRLFKIKFLHFLFIRLQLRIYLYSSKIKNTAKFWCEKNPLNILNIDEINEVFGGDVKFINIVRDGRDVVSSFHPRFGYMVKPKLWLHCIQQTIRYTSSANFLVIRYEDLIKDTSFELSRVKRFLNLNTDFSMTDWLDRTNVKGFVLSPVNNNMGVSIISSDVNQNSIGNWKKSESPNIKEFLADAGCINLNEQLGYS